MLKNVREVVIACENMLGLTHKNPSLKLARQRQAAKLKLLMADNPKLYTFRNFEATINLLAKRKQPVYDVSALKWWVEEAVSRVIEETPVSAVEDAIRFEQLHPRSESDYWVSRLVRVHEKFQAAALGEWKESLAGFTDD